MDASFNYRTLEIDRDDYLRDSRFIKKEFCDKYEGIGWGTPVAVSNPYKKFFLIIKTNSSESLLKKPKCTIRNQIDIFAAEYLNNSSNTSFSGEHFICDCRCGFFTARPRIPPKYIYDIRSKSRIPCK